jgi:hypothetical protein
MPQKQMHQIAMTAWRSAAPASGGFGPDRIGRLPSFAMALVGRHYVDNGLNIGKGIPRAGEVLAGRTAVPMLGVDAVANGDQLGWSPSRAPHATPLGVAIDVAPTASRSLQTDSHWIITDYLSRSVDRPSDLLGGMWAVVATVFAFKETPVRSLSAGIARLVATCVSFALCLLYVLLFPFTPVGVAVLIGIGTVAAALLGRRNDLAQQASRLSGAVLQHYRGTCAMIPVTGDARFSADDRPTLCHR